MSPRNEFQARDHEGEPGEDGEDLNQEVEPVEADPHRWPIELTKSDIAITLADLRKGPSLGRTEADIAEMKKSDQAPD